jgi:shikimate kinase
MIVTLIGYRGTGKSSIAPRLAERWGSDCIDADVELERRAGRSIREIFATDGEAEFRRLERDVLVDLLQRDRLVLAAGGGAILNADTRRDFRAAGPVVWLQADVSTIAERIGADVSSAARRPNLTSAGTVAEIENVLRQREPLYRETATLIVNTTGQTVDALVDEIAHQVGWAARETP